MNSTPLRLSLAVTLLGLTSAALALVQGSVDRAPTALSDRAFGLEEPGVEVDEDRQQELRSGDAWARFSAAQNGLWGVDFDLTTGRPRRMLGRGIPLLPGKLNDLTPGDLPPSVAGPVRSLTPETVEAVARDFLAARQDLFGLDLGQWGLDPAATVALDGGLQYIALVRRIDGVPVRGSRLTLALKHGNLIYLHGTYLDDIQADTRPALAGSAALERSVGGLGQDDIERLGSPVLELIPVAAGDGTAREFRLAWTVRFRVAGYLGTWVGTMDAHTGELLELFDDNRYDCELDPTVLQGRVQGGVRPAKADDPEVLQYLPFTAVTDDGAPKVTDFNGWYFYSGHTAESTLSGRYFDVRCVGCTGQPRALSDTSGYIDFGFGGVDQNWNGMSTPADRTAYFHLNVSRAMGAKWLDLGWLKSTVGVNVNINNSCNAFWDGSSVNFFRSGGGCGNTGEIRDVMQHEWGHGLDQNDGSPRGDGATGEAIGDHIALFVDHDSCIGQSFAGWSSTGPYCLTNPDCSTTASCTGVRNTDEKRASRGLLSVGNVTSKCPAGGGCIGPMNRQCHCEGEIWGQAAFHLTMNLLTGNDYATGSPIGAGNPAYPEPAAWYVHERLFFQGLPMIASYGPSTIQNRGPGAYDAYMVVDDDDGNLSNGTPNAAYINAALTHHGIEEQTLIGDSANCAAPDDPATTLTALIDPVSGNNQVRVSWPDVDAAFYVVNRTERLGDVWLPVREQVPDDQSPSYDIFDEPVRNGATYYYSVLAVSPSGCISGGGNTRSVTVALPELEVADQSHSDPAPGGDGDGVPEPGEAIRLAVDLKEVGDFVGAGNVTAVLSSDDPLVTITEPGPVSFGSFAASQTRSGAGEFELYIGESHGCDTDIPLKLAISSDDGCWLRALKVFIPAGGCTPRPRAEAGVDGFSIVADDLDPACTDEDGLADAGETVLLGIDVLNTGTLAATNVEVALGTQSPWLTITSPNPVTLPGSLAGGESGAVEFEVEVGDAPCQQPAEVVATVSSPENAVPLEGRFSLTLEEDQLIQDLSFGFETGLGNWTAEGFELTNRRAGGGSRSAWAGLWPSPCGQGNTQGSYTCASLTSPVVFPSAGTSLTLSSWFEIEDFGGGQWWDRANVHVIDGFSHTLLTPSTGRDYTVSPDSYDLCHIAGEAGWAGSNGTSWAASSFDLSPWAGKAIQIEINYSTDGAEACEGFYVDDVVLTDVVVKDCDAHVCAAPLADVVLESCSVTDLCDLTGASDGQLDPFETATFTLGFRNLGSGPAGDFRADIEAASGGAILSGGSAGGGVDIAAGDLFEHIVEVEVTTICGDMLDMSVLNMRATSQSFGNALADCDRVVGGLLPGGQRVHEQTSGELIPDTAEFSLWSSLDVGEPTPVNDARLEIDVSHLVPSELVALVHGPGGGQLDATPAIGGSLDVSSFYEQEGPGEWTLQIWDGQPNKQQGRLTDWQLVLDVPDRSSCTPCVEPTCQPPSLDARAAQSRVCTGGYAVLSADLAGPGQGVFIYSWDFGDGSSPEEVVEPTSAVPHVYEANGIWQARLTATSASDPSCFTTSAVNITVQPGTAPTGGVGNQVRAIKRDRQHVELTWSGATVDPALYNLHKTTDELELEATPAGIGDEPLIVSTSETEASDRFALMTPTAAFFYQVLAADSCGGSVLP